MSGPAKIAVLGGGLSGLATAYFLKKRFPDADLRIFEKAARAGGLIETRSEDGCQYELGPRGLRSTGGASALLSFVREINLEGEIVPADSAAKTRYVCLDGKLLKVPSHPLAALTSPVTRGILGGLFRDLRAKAPTGSQEDESIRQFAERHFGPTVTRNLVDPVVSGIWAGDIDRLSARANLPEVVKIEARYGSLIKGLLRKRRSAAPTGKDKKLAASGLFTFQGGMSRLTDRLAERLGSALHLSATVRRIDYRDGRFELVLSDDGRCSADTVISTLPAYALADVLEAADKELSELLKSILYAPLAVVYLAYPLVVNPYRGYGYLVGGRKIREILGVQFNRETFPQLEKAGSSSFTVFIGGAMYRDFEKTGKEDFVRLASRCLRTQLNLEEPPVFTHCRRISRALPQYNMGYPELLTKIKNRCPDHLHISGNIVGGVGIANILRNAEQLSDKLAQAYL